MRILLAWPGHSHSTADVADGYAKALTNIGHEVRHFDYHNRMSFYAEALDHFEKVHREGRRRGSGGFRRRSSDTLIMASESIILEAVDFVPDVVLIVNGMNLHRRAFDLLKRLRLPVIMLLTESPYLDEWQAKIATQGHAAAILTNDKNSVKPLSNMTGLPVEYLPHSYDAERHRPRPIDDYYATDIFFHGTLFPERMDTFITLGELIDDYKIHIDGIILDGEHEISEDDLMDNREMAFYYANTKVVLNKHRTIAANIKGEDLHIGANEAYSIGPRLYEAAACGAFQVSDGSRPELHDVFNGHIPTYRDGDELLEMVRYYLIHDKEREAMADAAREAVQGCTFENRAQNIVIPFFMEVTNGSTL